MATRGISKEELAAQGYEQEKIDDVFSIVKYVGRYLDMEAILKTGMTISWKDYDFEHALMFAWIKQGRN